MSQQIFLGGTCGTTTWRSEIAIPALEAAGVTYHNPQRVPGEWTPAHEDEDRKAKDVATVQLFVITGATRGIASLVEVAYFLAAGRPLALVLEDVLADAVFNGRTVAKSERDDLNRGRLFVRTMAEQHGVPVFTSVADATAHAIHLLKQTAPDTVSVR